MLLLLPIIIMANWHTLHRPFRKLNIQQQRESFLSIKTRSGVLDTTFLFQSLIMADRGAFCERGYRLHISACLNTSSNRIAFHGASLMGWFNRSRMLKQILCAALLGTTMNQYWISLKMKSKMNDELNEYMTWFFFPPIRSLMSFGHTQHCSYVTVISDWY